MFEDNFALHSKSLPPETKTKSKKLIGDILLSMEEVAKEKVV